MKLGIKRKEFIPYYQAIIDSNTGKTVGCEVLMRWKMADRMVPPNQFIPFAESSGLILDMTKSLIDHVVLDIQKLCKFEQSLFFSINIVPEHLESDDLYLLLKQIMQTNVLGHHRLSLEITERLPIKDLNAARERLNKIYSLGIDLKIDDAGTGYGGFSYILNLGVSTLKIDKMFVDTIGNTESFNAKTIDAIIGFANQSGLEMIAEGVESQNQVEYLAQRGVHLIQGYVYAKPEPADTFFQQLQKRQG